MPVGNGHQAALISELVAGFGARPEMLIQILHRVVEQFGFVSEAAIRQLADELNLSRAEVHGVVSYYDDFRTEARGRHSIRICQAEACQAMGSAALTRHAQESLGLALHESSEDISLDPVYCLGNCACSPAVMINGRTYGRVTHERFDELVGAMGGDD